MHSRRLLMLLLPSYQLAQFTATYILTARCNTLALIMYHKLLIQAFTHDAGLISHLLAGPGVANRVGFQAWVWATAAWPAGL